jgi:membrane-associated HD superfamily phosphohydrolase
VYYFYRRALENSEHNQEVGEEEFRYLGPKPNSKETAIVLLADSVEAAARTLKEPTSTNIEDMVHKVINNKFIDGQLDECTLTLKDLEKISKVFTRILGGIYHSRIPYPENPK